MGTGHRAGGITDRCSRRVRGAAAARPSARSRLDTAARSQLAAELGRWAAPEHWMHVELLHRPPISGTIPECLYDAVGDCAWVRYSPEGGEAWAGAFGRGGVSAHIGPQRRGAVRRPPARPGDRGRVGVRGGRAHRGAPLPDHVGPARGRGGGAGARPGGVGLDGRLGTRARRRAVGRGCGAGRHRARDGHARGGAGRGRARAGTRSPSSSTAGACTTGRWCAPARLEAIARAAQRGVAAAAVQRAGAARPSAASPAIPLAHRRPAAELGR
jgi:hypothetical protein